MTIKSYSDLNSLELDTLREIGSIGTGNAATALSSLIGQQVRIEMPEVRIMGYNEAIEWSGGPEESTAGVLGKMSGQVNGIMLSVQQLKFVNLVLESMLGKGVEDYSGLHEMECSALIEVGYIMISPFINALSSLAGIDIELAVPAFTVDTQKIVYLLPPSIVIFLSNVTSSVTSESRTTVLPSDAASIALVNVVCLFPSTSATS